MTLDTRMYMLWQPLVKMSNHSNKLISKVSHRDHKKTQQEVSDAFLHYLYNIYMVCANDKYSYPKVHVLSIKSTILLPQNKHAAIIFLTLLF